ncbi:QcrA and Rieske domain-containing protein [Almyronema epifaneia]|uniref:Ubiquinol-cytochrome c reductase iron-sulfur subunit n=1 Tax=Almyronema epifaneia S1 TaxID=2991925 RepID=A0ABW6IBK5_9CYAN
MKRRKFVSWISVGALASSLPVVLAACNRQADSETTSPAASSEEAADTAPPSQEFESVGTLEQLDQAGQLLNEQAAVGPVLIVRNPDAATELAAVNPICTHAGCTVEWQSDQALFVCPCHNSQFQADGTVVGGPATQPLALYEVKQEADDILVRKA